MAKSTVASVLMKNMIKSAVLHVTNSFDFGICCSICAVELPDRLDGAYCLLGNTPVTEAGIRFCVHKMCSRDWILCKERDSQVWFRVRPNYDAAEPTTGAISMCEQAENGCIKNCPLGDECPKAHSETERRVWLKMDEGGLNYDGMHDIMLQDIENYFRGGQNGQNTNAAVSSANEITENEVSDQASIPDDAVRPGLAYEPQGFVLSASKKTYISIRVTHYVSPSAFYFQLHENMEQMNDLWNDMTSFYESVQGDGYKMTPIDLAPKLPAAIRVLDVNKNAFQWRRAILLDDYSVGTEPFLKVLDVDTGVSGTVTLENVRMLRGQYFQYYAQAIEGTTAYVRPSNDDHWSDEAVEFARSYFAKWPLVAEVIGTNLQGNRYALSVCDTSDPVIDVYLADTLIKHNLAMVSNNVAPFAFCHTGTVLQPNEDRSKANGSQ